MQNLLEKYPEGMNGLPSPEHRLVDRYYATKRERESLLGHAARFITIKYDNKKYFPVFDPRFEKEIAALHFKMLELERAEDSLLSTIDQISGKFETDIRGLHDEKKRCEVEIEKLNLFPAEQEALRARHKEINDLITEYTALLENV